MKVRKQHAHNTPSATADLSEFLTTTTIDDIPTNVIDHAVKMIRDTLGVSLGAVGTEPAEIARSLNQSVAGLPDSHLASVIGYGDRVPPQTAAFLNGILANALDFDDLHQHMGGHPSSPVLPAVLALCETTRATGEELMTAFVCGVEIETVFGRIMNPGHYERGWHPTAVYGHLGATAAAGVLLDLSKPEFQTAFGIATSHASGSKANLGAMTKPYHVGNAARAGVEAAQLAKAGFTARQSIIEDEFGGFCDLFKGSSGYEFADHLDRLGDPWVILDPPVVFKPYPCCASAHSAIDCAINLRETHIFDPPDITEITVFAHPRRLQHTDDPAPATGLEGKISIQYVVARALLQGDVWIDDFSESSFRQPQNQALMDRITLHRDADTFDTDEWGARVSITTTEDETYKCQVANPRGSVTNPLTDRELRDKYARCGSGVLNDRAVEHSLDLLDDLPSLKSITPIIDTITPNH